MTKTVFAGQLTIFANSAWGRTLYRDAPTWKTCTPHMHIEWTQNSTGYTASACSHLSAVGRLTAPRVAKTNLVLGWAPFFAYMAAARYICTQSTASDMLC